MLEFHKSSILDSERIPSVLLECSLYTKMQKGTADLIKQSEITKDDRFIVHITGKLMTASTNKPDKEAKVGQTWKMTKTYTYVLSQDLIEAFSLGQVDVLSLLQ